MKYFYYFIYVLLTVLIHQLGIAQSTPINKDVNGYLFRSQYDEQSINKDSNHSLVLTYNSIDSLALTDRVKMQRAAKIGGIAGTAIGITIAVVFWDDICKPSHPLCGKFSKEVYGLKGPPIIVGSIFGGLVGTGIGAIVGHARKKEMQSRKVLIQPGIISTRDRSLSLHPAVSVSLSLKRKP